MENIIKAPLPGKVLEVLVKPGDTVEDFGPVLVLEAMKMENEITADDGGVVKEVLVHVGDTVASGQDLIVME